MRLGSLAGWCTRHRWRVLAIWLMALVAVFVLGRQFGGGYTNSFTLPSVESQQAFDLLRSRFPQRSGDSAQIVFRAPAGVNAPRVRSHMTEVLTRVSHLPHVTGVSSPYEPGARSVSRDGRIAFATVQFDERARDLPKSVGTRLVSEVERARTTGIQVDAGGSVAEAAVRPSPPASEGIGVLAAIVILLIAFGSVIAVGVPIVTALFGLGIGLAGLTLVTVVFDVPEFAPQLAAMIGLGVGIDYALFILTRYRAELHRGHEPETAIRIALSTSGRAVLFAGCTVIISLLGMFLMGLSFVRGLALGAVLAVALMMLASVTLLPALLGFIGRSIDRFRLPGLHRDESAHRASFWFRWSRQVQRHPWVSATVGLVVLLTLAAPALSIHLGNSDAGSDPAGLTTRKAYDLLSEGFGPGFNGPLVVAARLPGPQAAPALQNLDRRLTTTRGVARVTPAALSPAGDAAIMTVYPTTSPQDRRTESLVRRLRDDVIPGALVRTGIEAKVGGNTAVGIDLSSYLAARLPLFIGVVLLLSFLLLMVVFRSLVVPLKAVVMNVLSIGAAYGVVVAIFQWGWLERIVGIDRTGPIEAFVPMMLFAVLFGLSMDYEVFLLSRVREEYLRTHDNATAVADGLAATARVITAAALIMVAVFLAFVLGPNRVVKLFGLGLASAILIDATLVRLLLVPATMELLGDTNWWVPRWLDRRLPRLDVEGDMADFEAELPPIEEPAPERV